MNFVEKIRLILKKNKWTQRQLAKAIGVEAARLNNWIKEKNGCKTEWIMDEIDRQYANAMQERR